MKRATPFAVLAALVAASAFAAAAPPLAGVWNIATSGKAASSGDLAFRVTAGDGSDPVDITVAIISGAGEESVARSIRRALASQLPPQNYNVEMGQGANVLVSDPRGRPNFSLELVDSDIDNMRVQVQSVTPAASPTVPAQNVPAVAPAPTPANTIPGNAVPGNGAPPANSAPAPAGVPAPGNQAPSPGAVPAPGMGVPPSPDNAPVPNPNVPVPSTPPAPSTTVPGSNAPPGTAPPPGSPTPSNGMGAGGAPASTPPPPGS